VTSNVRRRERKKERLFVRN